MNILISGSCVSSLGVSSCLFPNSNIINPCIFPTCSTIKLPINLSFSYNNTSGRLFPKIKLSASSSGIKHSRLSAATSLHSSSPLLHGTTSLPKILLPKLPRACKDNSNPVTSYDDETPQPQWWWRSLACLPFVANLVDVLAMHADYLRHIPGVSLVNCLTKPLYEQYHNILPFSGAYPILFLLGPYLVAKRRMTFPHFFRFYAAMIIVLQFAMTPLNLLAFVRLHDLSLFWEKMVMRSGTAMALAYLFALIYCIGCALVGTYANVPFLCDKAYTISN